MKKLAIKIILSFVSVVVESQIMRQFPGSAMRRPSGMGIRRPSLTVGIDPSNYKSIQSQGTVGQGGGTGFGGAQNGNIFRQGGAMRPSGMLRPSPGMGRQPITTTTTEAPALEPYDPYAADEPYDPYADYSSSYGSSSSSPDFDNYGSSNGDSRGGFGNYGSGMNRGMGSSIMGGGTSRFGSAPSANRFGGMQNAGRMNPFGSQGRGPPNNQGPGAGAFMPDGMGRPINNIRTSDPAIINMIKYTPNRSISPNNCNGEQVFNACAAKCPHPTCLFRQPDCEPINILACMQSCTCPPETPYWVDQLRRCVGEEWCDMNGPVPLRVIKGSRIAEAMLRKDEKLAIMAGALGPIRLDEYGRPITTTTLIPPITTTTLPSKDSIKCANGKLVTDCNCGRDDIYEMTCKNLEPPNCPDYRCRYGCACPTNKPVWDPLIESCIEINHCQYFLDELEFCQQYYNEDPTDFKRYFTDRKAHEHSCEHYVFCRFGKFIIEKCDCGYWYNGDSGKCVHWSEDEPPYYCTNPKASGC